MICDVHIELQLSVLFEIKDISEDPGWMEALQRNRDAGGTLELPIFLQGDRIYWGQVLRVFTHLGGVVPKTSAMQ